MSPAAYGDPKKAGQPSISGTASYARCQIAMHFKRNNINGTMPFCSNIRALKVSFDSFSNSENEEHELEEHALHEITKWNKNCEKEKIVSGIRMPNLSVIKRTLTTALGCR